MWLTPHPWTCASVASARSWLMPPSAAAPKITRVETMSRSDPKSTCGSVMSTSSLMLTASAADAGPTRATRSRSTTEPMNAPRPADLPNAFDNRVSRDLGVPIPIVQAPMGWIARAQLASAVSRCGACGIIETSSGELDTVKDEIRKMRDLTDRPFGVNIAQAFVRDPAIAEFVIDQGVKFVTTSAGIADQVHGHPEGGRPHRVPRRADARRGARRRSTPASTAWWSRAARAAGSRARRPCRRWCCCRSSRSKVDVPIIAAGGIIDGATMAAAFALGAEGVQMGTRMVSAAESPVHDNWKQAIIDAAETDTLFLNDRHSPALRALRTDRTDRARSTPSTTCSASSATPRPSTSAAT